MENYILTSNFEDIKTQFNIPKALIFKGEGVKEVVRKWKIKNLIKNNELSQINSK